MTISSTYTSKAKKDESTFLMNNEPSETDCLKPMARSILENLENHCRDAYFRPYSDLCKWQTTFGGKGSPHGDNQEEETYKLPHVNHHVKRRY